MVLRRKSRGPGMWAGLRTTLRAYHSSDSWDLPPASRSGQSLKRHICQELLDDAGAAAWGPALWAPLEWGGSERKKGWLEHCELRANSRKWGWRRGKGSRILASTAGASVVSDQWESLRVLRALPPCHRSCWGDYNVVSLWGVLDSAWHSPPNACAVDSVEFENNL